MRYALLSATKPSSPPEERGYTPDLWRELDDLYRGGYQIQGRAAAYLPPAVGERTERHKERLGLASYIGYFGGIVVAYASSLFAVPVAVVPAGDAEDEGTPGELPDGEAYDAFGRNADLRGSAFSQVLKGAAETALVKGKGLLAVDFPGGPPTATRADSDRAGVARPYAYEVQPEELTDWEYDSTVRQRVSLEGGGAVEWEVGRFAWVVLRRVVQRRASPAEGRAAPFEEFKIWRRRPEDGVVVWEIYHALPDDEGKPPKPETEIALVATGETTFREIPIVELRFPETLWLGNVIGPLNKEHWQRRSALLAAQQRALLVVPTVYLGPGVPEVGGSYNEVAENPHRGDDPARRAQREGYLVLGDKDRLAFEGPPTEAFTVIDGQLKSLVDEIHRVSGRMAASVSSTSKALSRSGASKALDNADFDTVCAAMGAVLADAARRVYTVISEARGEDVCWTVHGLDGYDSGADRASVLEEALQLGALDFGSRTAAIELRVRSVLALLPGLGPEAQATIRGEIAASVVAEGAKTPPLPEADQDEGEPPSQPGVAPVPPAGKMGA